ncbi:hypothetical protein CDD83_1378 [Cordyceps sp. RAO-2017]|nr:hypothetical protein CDD83_1378 [Cordyceps sp. RAO-2017]
MRLLKTVSALAASSLLWALAGASDGELEARSLTVEIPFQGGSLIGRSLLGVDTFSAIPYADPPVGPLRLRPPRRLSTKLGKKAVLGPAPGCPQMYVSNNKKDFLSSILSEVLKLPLLKPINGQEDCLTVTVQRPAGTAAGDKLPVFYWIYGGAFQLGATNTYDASHFLNAGVNQDQPFIFVAVNYRVGAFGFLAGREILKDGSANLGLLDQRMGLEWVSDNIEAFGGDPTKVTIWGESAGAISVFNQMVMYGGNATYKDKPLFRGAIMNSGGILPANPVDSPKAQATFDTVARHAGCGAAHDVLDCLRKVPYETFFKAANSVPGILSYDALALPYLPRPDGSVLRGSPDALLKAGKYYPIPMIIGDQEDEGTLFALLMGRLHTTDQIVDRLSRDFFPNATKRELTDFVDLYSYSLTEGSPFRTGIFNEFYFGYKRLAAIVGDLVFNLTRRLALGMAIKGNPNVAAWSYLASYNYGLPFLGTFHGSDLLRLFYDVVPDYATESWRTYYLNFAYNLDPNVGVGGYREWPLWTDNRELMWFETSFSTSILKDDFRSEAAGWMATHMNALHL